jgi:hypothetical protein
MVVVSGRKSSQQTEGSVGTGIAGGTVDGWIKLHRRLTHNPIWTQEPFTRGQAWVDLLLLANHAEKYIRVRGRRVPVKRGQVGWSEVKLAERWQWSRGKVRRFLKELKMDQQIEQQKNNATTLITIINYDAYQSDGTVDETADGQQTVQQTDSRRYPNKNDKNDKNVQEEEYVADGVGEDIVRQANNVACPHQEIIALYHETLPELPCVRVWNDANQKRLRARWREDAERQRLDWWRNYFTSVRGMPFLMGRVKEFQATLEWLVRPQNMSKVLNGQFIDRMKPDDNQRAVEAWLRGDA